MARGRARDLQIVISGDVKGLNRAFASAGRSAQSLERDVGRSLNRVEGTVSKSSRNVMRSVGHLAGAAGFAGLAGAIVGIGRAGVAYEQQMSRVRAVTDANGKQMRALGALAKKMGADTKFSAGEAASGMYELGAAGFKVNEMGGALKGTLALAAASNIELADASQITANALRGFRLDSNQATHVADVLARTVNASSVEMRDLQYSLKYIAPVAKTTGQSFEQMVAAVGEMGDAGIKGEQAGTTLRAALVRLTRPTKSVDAGLADLHLRTQDLQGPKGLKPLAEIVRLIETHTKGMDKATRNAALANIFGTEALSGMVAVIDRGSTALEKNTRANEKSDGSAKRAAKTMQDNVAGAWENLTGSIETAGISFYEKFQTPVKEGLLDLTGAVNTASKDVEDFFTSVGRDPKFKAGDLGDKLAVIGDELERRHVPEKVAHVITTGVEDGAKVAAHAFAAVAPQAAGEFVKSFAEAPIWLRALGVGFLLRKLGGLRAAGAAGAASGGAFARGFATTSAPMMAGAGGPAAAAVRGGAMPLTAVAARQRGAGWENFRSGAPVSTLGTQPGRFARGGARLATGVRGLGSGLMSAFGGPWGLALGAGLIAAPSVIQGVGRRSQDFNLPQTSKVFGLKSGGLVTRLAGKDPDVARFGDTAEKRLGSLTRAGDVRGLRQLADEAGRLAAKGKGAEGELRKFARAAQDAGHRAETAAHGLRGVQLKAGDILDPRAATTFQHDLQRMARDGASSIGQLRSDMESNNRLIERAFQSGSKGAADAMASNFRGGIQAVKRGMADGRISATDGMKEIRRIVRQQMHATAGHMDQFSDDGRAALARNFRSAADAIRTQMRRGTISTKSGLAEIRRLMAAELKTYGLSSNQAADVAATGALDKNLGREGGATRDSGDVTAATPGIRRVSMPAGLGTIGQIGQGALDKVRGAANHALARASSAGLGASGSVAGLAPAARSGLSTINELFGGVRVTSARRSAAENARVGGATNSDHLRGLAIDLVPTQGWTKAGTHLLDRIAEWARHNPMVRWIGWRGVPGHGPGDHLHLSFLPGGRASRNAGDVIGLPSGIRGVGDVIGEFDATSYGPPWGGIQGSGTTASGVDLHNAPHRYGVAADPRVLPLGKQVKIWPNPFGYRGAFQVFDTGGAIKGHRLDFYDWRGRQAQNAWGHRNVTVSSADGASSAGGGPSLSRAAVGKRIDSLDSSIDRLRARKDQLPAGKKGAAARRTLQNQINAKLRERRSLVRSRHDAPTGEDYQREARRSVAPLLRPFLSTASREGRAAAGAASDIETTGHQESLAQRRFDLTDEDLNTVPGRINRVFELTSTRGLQTHRLAAQRRRGAAIKRQISSYRSVIKRLQGQLKSGSRHHRPEIRRQIGVYQGRIRDLKEEARQLGFDIEDTQADIAGTDAEIDKVQAGPEAKDAPTGTAAVPGADTYLGSLDKASALAALTPDTQDDIDAATKTVAARQGILDYEQSHGFSDEDIASAARDLKGAQDALDSLTKATEDAAQAQEEHTAALKAVADEMKRQNDIATGVLSTSVREAWAAVADTISGQLGPKVALRGMTPGTGRPAVRY